jgi:DNA topoisomerase-1
MRRRFPTQDAGLAHVTDAEPGLSRRRAGAGFCYRDAKGRPVRDRATLARIRALAVPPAWTDVWICASPSGHLQATGRDARGRKQHRYHPLFRAVREAAKFERLTEFAAVLPALRDRVARDLRRKNLPRAKVLAAVVHLLDATLIRVGNDEYARRNGSYGLTTLKDRHAEIDGATLRFVFKGKSGRTWRLSLKDRRVASVVKKVQELPGQRLFQYVDADGAIQHVTSTDVNAYLREISGRDITAKDFRTWGATVLAAAEFDALGPASTQLGARAGVKDAIERVAGCLGNTPAICRKCYVHPDLIDSYLRGAFALPRAKRAGLSAHEASVLAFLERQRGRRAAGTQRLRSGSTGVLAPTTISGSSSKPG